jgi:hypothetical protein
MHFCPDELLAVLMALPFIGALRHRARKTWTSLFPASTATSSIPKER